MPKEKAVKAGCIPLKIGKKKLKVLLVTTRSQSGKEEWIFPKGTVEDGEEHWEAALRETEEEAGLKGRLGQCLGTIADKKTTVTYYVLYVDKQKFKHWDEKDERSRRWLELEEARTVVERPAVIEALRRLREFIKCNDITPRGKKKKKKAVKKKELGTRPGKAQSHPVVTRTSSLCASTLCASRSAAPPRNGSALPLSVVRPTLGVARSREAASAPRSPRSGSASQASVFPRSDSGDQTHTTSGGGRELTTTASRDTSAGGGPGSKLVAGGGEGKEARDASLGRSIACPSTPPPGAVLLRPAPLQCPDPFGRLPPSPRLRGPCGGLTLAPRGIDNSHAGGAHASRDPAVTGREGRAGSAGRAAGPPPTRGPEGVLAGGSTPARLKAEGSKAAAARACPAVRPRPRRQCPDDERTEEDARTEGEGKDGMVSGSLVGALSSVSEVKTPGKKKKKKRRLSTSSTTT